MRAAGLALQCAPLIAVILLVSAGIAQAQSGPLSALQTETLIANLLSSSIPDSGLACSVNITGNFTNARPSNTTGSSNVDSAAIACTGGTLRIVSGPSLQPFASAFQGVEVTVDNGLPGATLTIRNQTLTLFNSNFKNLTPSGEATLVLIRSNVTIKTATFVSNKQATAGAIRANETSNVAIMNSTFLNNTGANAGAISIFNSSLFINGSSFTNNTGQQGGAVLFQNGSASVMRVASSVFSRNSATTGGGIFAQDCRQSVLYNNVFQLNRASGSGGAMFQLNCPGSLILNAVLRNNATAGGGAYINNVRGLNLEYNEWSGNTAAIGSGGVDLQSVANATISNDTFAQNQGQQGGAYFGTATACTFTSCTFTSNNASLNGGGIFRTQGSGEVSLCLFQSNIAGKFGGGIYDSQVSGDIRDNMFTRNVGDSASGAGALFRLQSAGEVEGNTGLNSSNFINQLPNATAATALPVAG